MKGRRLLLALLLAPTLTVAGATAYRFERQWPALQQPWYFVALSDVARDSQGYLYVADRPNCSVKALSADGRIYVNDKFNRVQAFRSQPLVQTTKAIVAAGGGPFPGNALWSVTQLNANFAYRTPAFQGFDRNTIHYLTADTDLDLDQNGVADDVDAGLSNDNLRQAILGPMGAGTDGFAGDVNDLVIYLVDHGRGDAFRMSGTETLAASQVKGWLDTWQAAVPGRALTIVYDACQSGSFLNELGAPGRIVITSASGTENAYFVSQGTLSFSNLFWTEIFNGKDLEQAYITARQGGGGCL